MRDLDNDTWQDSERPNNCRAPSCRCESPCDDYGDEGKVCARCYRVPDSCNCKRLDCGCFADECAHCSECGEVQDDCTCKASCWDCGEPETDCDCAAREADHERDVANDNRAEAQNVRA